MVEESIFRAQSYVEGMSHRILEPLTETRYYDADLESGRLQGHGVASATELILDEDLLEVTALVNGDGTALPAAAYVLQPANEYPKYKIRLRRGYHWTYTLDPIQAIQVTGTWGFVPADHPRYHQIKQAIVRLAGFLYKQRDSQVWDTAGFLEGGVLTIPQGAPRFTMDVIENIAKVGL